MLPRHDKPFVSVIVPIYNTAPYLPQCIESIRSSSWREIEIILVNDGSTDESGLICEHAAKSDVRIQVIHQANKGLVYARKTGLNRSSGEYVCYVDGDDWIQSDFIETLATSAIEKNSDVVVAGHIEDLHGSQEALTNSIPAGDYSGNSLFREVFPVMMNTGSFSEFGIFSYVWGKLFRRELLAESQTQVDDDIVVGEDAACLYPLLLKSKQISIVQDAKYVYRQRANSMIKTADSKENHRMQRLYDFLKCRFSQLQSWEMMRLQTFAYVLSLAIVRCAPQNNSRNHEPHLLHMYRDCQPGQRVALFGAGTLGQFLARRIMNSAEFSLVAWADPRWQLYRQHGLDIVAPQELPKKEWDKLLVCYIDEKISTAQIPQLTAIGVKQNSISTIYIPKTSHEPILSAYGIKT